MLGDEPPATQARVLVSGRVQGVYFRDSLRELAEEAGVTGWVRNLPDGRVEALLEGAEDAVGRLVAWCRAGPTGAWVRDCHVACGPAGGQHHYFRIERTPYP